MDDSEDDECIVSSQGHSEHQASDAVQNRLVVEDSLGTTAHQGSNDQVSLCTICDGCDEVCTIRVWVN